MGQTPPHQKVFPIGDAGKFLVFPSGKCRIMGLRRAITRMDLSLLPFQVKNVELQSLTLVHDLKRSINLRNLAENLPTQSYIYEPELFCALRLIKFGKLCVNVFSSGKVVILGVKTLNYDALIGQISNLINTYYKSPV